MTRRSAQHGPTVRGRSRSRRDTRLYHEDAILEFPAIRRAVPRQIASFLTWRKQYPASVDYRIRRITGEGELWVIELLVSYNGSPPMFGVSIIRFRGDRIARESIYVAEPFPASEVRRDLSTPFDPLASVSPSAWQPGVPFGIEG